MTTKFSLQRKHFQRPQQSGVEPRSSEWMVRDSLNINKAQKGQNKKWTIKKYIGANT